MNSKQQLSECYTMFLHVQRLITMLRNAQLSVHMNSSVQNKAKKLELLLTECVTASKQLLMAATDAYEIEPSVSEEFALFEQESKMREVVNAKAEVVNVEWQKEQGAVKAHNETETNGDSPDGITSA